MSSYTPSPDIAAGLAGLQLHPLLRAVCLSGFAGNPSPREVRQWSLNDIAAVLVMEEASQEAQRQAHARMSANQNHGGR